MAKSRPVTCCVLLCLLEEGKRISTSIFVVSGKTANKTMGAKSTEAVEKSVETYSRVDDGRGGLFAYGGRRIVPVPGRCL